ncbi:hypothetical protein NKI72_26745 [Mesorhizobium sp. M0437]|uniref:hypothetical protein n=1 Tax=Mesorhizobium sp. M0437 TaxID=2956945 RepID=UPI003337210B
MTLSADRNTPRAERGFVKMVPMAAALIYAGALVCRNAAGFAVKGSTALGLQAIGRANERVDNSGGNAGDLKIKVEEGIFRWANSAAADEITEAEVGKACFIVDDEKVAKTSGSGTRSLAGIVMAIDAVGVYVLMGEDVLAGYLEGRKMFVPLRVATLVGANVYRALSPYPGVVRKIRSVTEGVLTTGDATLTGKIDGVAITTGVITIAQAASAAGDKDSCDPTAANYVAAGGELSLTVGGTNATATAANCVFEIDRD